MQHWTELVPGDTYRIQSSGKIYADAKRVLTLLYQPLVGVAAISLYMTIWSELEENRTLGSTNSHYFLMSILNLPLQDIFKARLKLEAIGLLKSYRTKDQSGQMYVYEILPPLSPNAFFHDALLSHYLNSRLGELTFNKLRGFFRDESKAQELSSKEEVTRSFHEVFSSSVTPSKQVTQTSDGEWLDHSKGKILQVMPTHFSLDLFYGGLSETFIDRKSITPVVEDMVLKLSYIYQLSPLDMQKVVIEAMNNEHEVDLDELRKAAKTWYELQGGEAMPVLVEKSTNLKNENTRVPVTKEEKLLRYLETVTPKQLLTDLSHGSQPSRADLSLVESLLIDQGLSAAVANVLLYNVMLKQDMKLTRSYVEKIAGHWARKNIQTAKEAMSLAKQEHQKQSTTGRRPTQKRNTSGRKEMLPDWFKEEKDRKKDSMKNASHDDFDFEKERKKLEAELKKK